MCNLSGKALVTALCGQPSAQPPVPKATASRVGRPEAEQLVLCQQDKGWSSFLIKRNLFPLGTFPLFATEIKLYTFGQKKPHYI